MCKRYISQVKCCEADTEAIICLLVHLDKSGGFYTALCVALSPHPLDVHFRLPIHHSQFLLIFPNVWQTAAESEERVPCSPASFPFSPQDAWGCQAPHSTDCIALTSCSPSTPSCGLAVAGTGLGFRGSLKLRGHRAPGWRQPRALPPPVLRPVLGPSLASSLTCRNQLLQKLSSLIKVVSFVLVTEIAELKVELAVVIPTLYRNNAVFPSFVFSRNLLCCYHSV